MPINKQLQIRFDDEETAFLLDLEEFQYEGRKRRGVGPAVHRLIALAREWDKDLAGPTRAYMRAEGLTVEQFAEMAELEPWVVADIVTLKTRFPARTTEAKIRRFIGD